MIFAFDLDRTLIFSEKLISDYSIQHVMVGSKEKVYMTSVSFNMLKELSNLIDIVPITSRSIEEYAELELLNELSITYKIMSSGSVLYISDRVDEKFRADISSKMVSFNMSVNDIATTFKHGEYSHCIKKTKLIGEVGMYVTIEKGLDIEENSATIKKLHSKNWDTYIIGNKVYVLPNFISKWNAVNYLNENYLGRKKVFSAGDSYLDKPLIMNSNFALMPKHSDFFPESSNVKITESIGTLAGEEIVMFISNYVKAQKNRNISYR